MLLKIVGTNRKRSGKKWRNRTIWPQLRAGLVKLIRINFDSDLGKGVIIEHRHGSGGGRRIKLHQISKKIGQYDFVRQGDRVLQDDERRVGFARFVETAEFAVYFALRQGVGVGKRPKNQK
jgi:hypothetical protein